MEEARMTQDVYPPSLCGCAEKRRSLTPETSKTFHAFNQPVSADTAIPTKARQLIAAEFAHVAKYSYNRANGSRRHGAKGEELTETI